MRLFALLQKFALAPRHSEHPKKYAAAEKQVQDVEPNRSDQKIPAECLIKEDGTHALEDVSGGCGGGRRC